MKNQAELSDPDFLKQATPLTGAGSERSLNCSLNALLPWFGVFCGPHGGGQGGF